MLPRTVDFLDIASTISYDTAEEGQAAIIHYSYQGVDLGSASVDLAVSQDRGYSFNSSLSGEGEAAEGENVPTFVFVNVKKVLLWVGILAVAVFAIWGEAVYEGISFPGPPYQHSP